MFRWKLIPPLACNYQNRSELRATIIMATHFAILYADRHDLRYKSPIFDMLDVGDFRQRSICRDWRIKSPSVSSASVWGLAKNLVDTSKRRRRTSKKNNTCAQIERDWNGLPYNNMESESLLNNTNVIVSRLPVLVKPSGGARLCDDLELTARSVSFVELFLYTRNKWVSLKSNLPQHDWMFPKIISGVFYGRVWNRKGQRKKLLFH